jgi:hypothetical protein
MTDPAVVRAVEQAVDRAYAGWAARHPSLAAVMDHITIRQQTARRLRESPEYRQAIEAYHQARREQTLITQLTDLAGPILQSVLGL